MIAIRRACIKESTNAFSVLRKNQVPKILTVKLPLLRSSAALFEYGDSMFTLAMHVQKKEHWRYCQDTAIMYLSKSFCMFGVFDGYGEIGGEFSDALAKNICMLGPELQIESDAGLIALLRNATSVTIDATMICNGRHSGTTALLLAISPDKRYLVAGIGDSAPFLVSRGTVARFLGYDTIGICGEERAIRDCRPTQSDYIHARHISCHSIRPIRRFTYSGSTYTGFEDREVETAGGTLNSGERLLLVSDGVTKNLSVMIDSDGRVGEVSGCADIADMAAQESAESLSARLLRLVNERIALRRPEGAPQFFASKNGVLMPADDDITIIEVGRR